MLSQKNYLIFFCNFFNVTSQDKRPQIYTSCSYLVSRNLPVALAKPFSTLPKIPNFKQFLVCIFVSILNCNLENQKNPIIKAFFVVTTKTMLRQTSSPYNFSQPPIEVCSRCLNSLLKISTSLFCCPLFLQKRHLKPKVKVNNLANEHGVPLGRVFPKIYPLRNKGWEREENYADTYDIEKLSRCLPRRLFYDAPTRILL